jgi:hypothetical protein
VISNFKNEIVSSPEIYIKKQHNKTKKTNQPTNTKQQYKTTTRKQSPCTDISKCKQLT